MNGLQIFTYNGNEVRIVQKDGEPWWVLKDVCEVLGISKYRDTSPGPLADVFIDIIGTCISVVHKKFLLHLLITVYAGSFHSMIS